MSQRYDDPDSSDYRDTNVRERMIPKRKPTPAPSQTGTPMTDALLSNPLKFDCKGAWFAQGMTGRLIDFARQLERELAEAQAQVKLTNGIRDADARVWSDDLQALRVRSVKAEAELSQAKRDAERYRWLREQDWNTGEMFVVKQPTQVRLGTDCPSRDRLDAFIDAALAKREGEGS